MIGAIETSESLWRMHLGPLDVPNFRANPTRFTSVGVALRYGEADETQEGKKAGRYLNALLIMRREPKTPVTPEEFRTDVRAITKGYLGKGRFLGREWDRDPKLLLGGIAGGAVAGGGLGVLIPGEAMWSSAILGTIFGGVIGTQIGAAAFAFNERKKREKIPRLGEYLADFNAERELEDVSIHTEEVKMQRQLFRALRRDGLNLTAREFMDQFEELNERTKGSLHDKRLDEMESGTNSDGIVGTDGDAIEKMVLVVGWLREERRRVDNIASREGWAQKRIDAIVNTVRTNTPH